MALAVKVGVGTGGQLAPSTWKYEKPLVSRQTLEYYSTLDLRHTFE